MQNSKNILWALFLFSGLSSTIYAQGFERTFSEGNMKYLNGMDSIAPNIWKLNFLNYLGENHALYYPERDSLGTHKVINNGTVYYLEAPLTKLSETQQIRLRFYDTYALIYSYWIDLEDTVHAGEISHPFMAASFNWLAQRDSVFALFSTTSWESYVEHKIGSDSILLVNMDAKTGQYQVLDTFLLRKEILSPGTFIFNLEQQKVEYINDSLHYFFQRGKKEADSFFIDTGAYFDRSHIAYSRGRAFWTNYNTLRNNLFGKFRIVKDTLNADEVKIETLRNGDERLIYVRNFPHSIDPNIPSPIPYLVTEKRQDSLLFSYAYASSSQDTIQLYRVEDDVITQRQLYKRPANSDFEIREVHSFHDGSFILSGYIDYWYSESWGAASARPHLIFIDKDGKSSRVSMGSLFQLHFNSRDNKLKVFFKDPFADLRYRIIDSSGRPVQEGNFQANNGIALSNWSAGVYYVQLWGTENYLGQEAFYRTRE